MPILTHVLLRAERGGLKLVASNLDIGLSCMVPAKVEDDGAIALPARLLIDLVNSLHPGPLDLQLNVRTKQVRLQCPPYDALISGLEAEDFPIMPVFPGDPAIRVAQADLLRGISEVAFAAASDDGRPMLTGVVAKFSGHELTLAASDGYRLAERRCTVLDNPGGNLELIIPARSLMELTRVLKDSDDSVDIALNSTQSQLIFRLNNVELVTRLIEGTYVDYAKVVPATYASRAVMARGELLEAVRVASLFARDTNNVIQLELFPQESHPVVVSAVGSPSGSNVGKLAASVRGPRVKVGFNSRYFTEALTNAQAAEVVLEFGGQLSPCVIRLTGDDRYVHVLMPIRMAS
jgi:DNA polymerase-3 subunit beta